MWWMFLAGLLAGLVIAGAPLLWLLSGAGMMEERHLLAPPWVKPSRLTPKSARGRSTRASR